MVKEAVAEVVVAALDVVRRSWPWRARITIMSNAKGETAHRCHLIDNVPARSRAFLHRTRQTMCNRSPIQCIVPPRLLDLLLAHENPAIRASALATLLGTARLRGQRELLAKSFAPSPAGGLNRSIFDAGSGSAPFGRLVRGEGQASIGDRAANDVYDGFGATYDLYRTVFHRDSIDGKGLRLEGVVHFGEGYNNAFWNGSRMIFGDGDGQSFIGFTQSLDVIGHELAHGVTEFTCALEYHRQSGALNESMSDVFGTLVKQYKLGQAVEAADWLIGAGILGPAIAGRALRSMREPGTAFAGDDQPSHMDGYVDLPDTDAGDQGGVHTNSGIPNKAFYLVASALGGSAWEAAGLIWYDTLLALKPTSDFMDCANTTYHLAGKRFGVGGHEQEAVGHAWTAVGVSIEPQAAIGAMSLSANASALRYRLKDIAQQVERAVDLVQSGL